MLEQKQNSLNENELGKKHDLSWTNKLLRVIFWITPSVIVSSYLFIAMINLSSTGVRLGVSITCMSLLLLVLGSLDWAIRTDHSLNHNERRGVVIHCIIFFSIQLILTPILSTVFIFGACSVSAAFS